MKAILALDQGTTSSRAIVFDSEGKVVASAQREFRQIVTSHGYYPARLTGQYTSLASSIRRTGGATSLE